MDRLPQRDIPTLIEALRIRALALTGEAWERTATRDMMNEAAQQLENLTAKGGEAIPSPPPDPATCDHHWAVEAGYGPRGHGASWCTKCGIDGEAVPARPLEEHKGVKADGI
jgi:hypothetical protein